MAAVQSRNGAHVDRDAGGGGGGGGGGLAIDVTALTFRYQKPNTAPDPPVLHDVSLTLPKGSICILVGANGAGKSTLLQILAGKKLIRGGAAKVLEEEVFFGSSAGVTYLGTEWAMNPVVRSDISVSHFLESVGGSRYSDRRDLLLDIMDVDLDWHMHQVSDGERRRVQIVYGLMQPFEVLLLDEVTVDLDVLVRSRFLDFLSHESTSRGATILYATHIFDGLDSFPSHLCHLRLGSTVAPSPVAWPIPRDSDAVSAGVRERMDDASRKGSRMLEVALQWLVDDKEERVRLGGARGATAQGGAKAAASSIGRGGDRDTEQALPSDPRDFYNKYDYSK